MTTRPAEIVSGVTTSWVPFTTPGPSLSPECSSAFYLQPGNPASIGAFDPWYGQNVNTSLQCQAAQQTTWWDQANLAQFTLWNLGPLDCPNGYTTATTQSINPSSTVLACCPSGFGYQSQNGIPAAGTADECLSTLTSGQVITPMSSASGSWVPTTMTITETGSVIHGVQINGWNFPSTSTPAPSTTSIVATVTNSGSAASATTSSSSNGGSGGLSSGAKAGIGIGVALGAIAFGCLLAFFVVRGRNAKRLRDKEGLQAPPDYEQGEVPKTEKYTGIPQHDMEPVEVSGETRPAEVAGESRPVEIG